MKKLIYLLGVGVLGLTSCEQEPKYLKTASGLEYLIHTNLEGETAKVGDYITMNIEYKTTSDTSLQKQNDITFELREPQNDGADITELILLMKEGDSATAMISIDSMIRNPAQIPPPFKSGDTMVHVLKVIKIQTKEAFEEQKKKDQLELSQRYGEMIEDYAQEKGLELQKSETGLYYLITEAGEGENAKQGDQIQVHYTGMLIDGTKFDSSVDRGQPLPLTLGVGQVIPGWDEGLTYFNKGAKGLLVIPPYLAYGERGAGEVIPPNSILVFEIELVSIGE